MKQEIQAQPQEEEIKVVVEQPQAEEEIIVVNSFGYLIDKAIELYCKKNITKDNAVEFKNTLISIKELYGTRLSREYFKPYFTIKRARQTQRFQKICKKADIKVTKELRYTEKLISKNGNLIIQKDRDILTFFDI